MLREIALVRQRRFVLFIFTFYSLFLRYCSYDFYLFLLLLSNALLLYIMKNSNKINVQMAKRTVRQRVGWAKQWLGGAFRRGGGGNGDRAMGEMEDVSLGEESHLGGSNATFIRSGTSPMVSMNSMNSWSPNNPRHSNLGLSGKKKRRIFGRARSKSNIELGISSSFRNMMDSVADGSSPNLYSTSPPSSAISSQYSNISPSASSIPSPFLISPQLGSNPPSHILHGSNTIKKERRGFFGRKGGSTYHGPGDEDGMHLLKPPMSSSSSTFSIIPSSSFPPTTQFSSNPTKLNSLMPPLGPSHKPTSNRSTKEELDSTTFLPSHTFGLTSPSFDSSTNAVTVSPNFHSVTSSPLLTMTERPLESNLLTMSPGTSLLTPLNSNDEKGRKKVTISHGSSEIFLGNGIKDSPLDSTSLLTSSGTGTSPTKKLNVGNSNLLGKLLGKSP